MEDCGSTRRTMFPWIRVVWASLTGLVVRIEPPGAVFRASRHVEPCGCGFVLVSSRYLLPQTSTIHCDCWVKFFFQSSTALCPVLFFSHKILAAFLISSCQRFWGLLSFCSDVNHLPRHLLLPCLIHCLRAFFSNALNSAIYIL